MKCKLLNFLKCLIDERCLMLFLAGTIATYSHHCILGVLSGTVLILILSGRIKSILNNFHRPFVSLVFIRVWYQRPSQTWHFFILDGEFFSPLRNTNISWSGSFFENKYLSQSEKISSPEKYFPFSKVSQTVNPQIASILWVRFQYFWLLSVYLKHGLAYCSPVSPSSPN